MQAEAESVSKFRSKPPNWIADLQTDSLIYQLRLLQGERDPQNFLHSVKPLAPGLVYPDLEPDSAGAPANSPDSLTSSMNPGAVMKTIGLIGGMSWESSIEYYRILNQTVRSRLGGLHSAKCIMFSVDFADIEQFQHEGNWQAASAVLVEAAQQLQMAGAGLVMLCTNTMHKLADDIEARISVPFLHIADAVGDSIQAEGLRRVGLLGTKFTMEQDFYRQRLMQRYGLEVLIPNLSERDRIHQIIYSELCVGKVNPVSARILEEIITSLESFGAEGIILGCTELELLVSQSARSVSLFPTTQIHAETAVNFALQSS